MSKRETNCNTLSCLNIWFITRLCFVNSYMMYILSDDVVTDQRGDIFQALHCHCPRRFIVMNFASLLVQPLVIVKLVLTKPL